MICRMTLIVGCLLLSDVSAQTLTTVFSRSPNQFGNQFGASVDVTDKWIAIGEPGNDDLGTDIGAVQIVNAVTRAYIRTLYPGTPAQWRSLAVRWRSVAMCWL